jgi:hypothetical protein
MLQSLNASCLFVTCMRTLQLFVPLLSPHLANPAAAAAAAAAGPDGEQARQQGRRQHPVAGVFSLLQEVAMRQAGGLTAEDIDRGFGQPLEQMGVSLTFGGWAWHVSEGMCVA